MSCISNQPVVGPHQRLGVLAVLHSRASVPVAQEHVEHVSYAAAAAILHSSTAPVTAAAAAELRLEWRLEAALALQLAGSGSVALQLLVLRRLRVLGWKA